MQVGDYILKPVTAAEMEEILLRLGEQLDNENRHKRDYEKLKLHVDELILKLPPTPSDDELFRFAIYNIAKEITEKNVGTEVFRERGNRVLVLLSGTDPEALCEEAGAVAEEIQTAITTYLPVKASIGIGHTCRLEDNVGAGAPFRVIGA